ncbi:MAG: polyprenyl synthetase family protein [Deltaproteobacteria bacterium]|nr:polyprenyl synthetase family protein [Deltaproteobacteria bacterium]
MNFSDYFKKHTRRIDEILDSLLPGEQVVPATIHRAMRYSLFNGGKRVRPIIAIASAEYMDIDVDRIVYSIGAMIEMVHAYSLVHDDLPSMDNDDFRRGKPTVHRLFNEAVAILAGDALLTAAFEAMGMLRSYKKNGDLGALLTEFASAIGSRGLVGGQVMDLEKKGAKLTEKDILFIHKNKTAALMTFAAIAPALFFRKQTYVSDMRRYGESLGMAFQIGDDIVDRDRGSGEPSAVDVFGIDGAKRLFYEYMGKAEGAVQYKKKGGCLIAVCDWIKQEFDV